MKKYNILYQFNEGYAPYAGVSILSLLINNTDADEINIYVLEENISAKSKALIKKTVQEYGRNIFFYATQTLIQLMKEYGIPNYRNSYATNFKMFFPLILNIQNMDKLLYIDSDTVIIGSLSPLFHFDLLGKSIGMAKDSLGKTHKRYIGLTSNDNYYNAGVILIDVQAWVERKCTQQVISHIKNVRAHYMSPDQDILNIVFRHEITTLPVEFNLQPVHYAFRSQVFCRIWNDKTYYSIKEIDVALDHPIILHFFRFLGEFPWDKNSIHPYKDVFDKYLALSDWKTYKKRPAVQQGITFKIERMLYCYLPEQIFLLIFKLNYELFLLKASLDSLKGQNNRNM